MPQLTHPTTADKCDYCGNQARYYAINSKAKRCSQQVSECPGIIAKQKQARLSKTSPEQRRANAKKANRKAQEKLQNLQQDKEWVRAKNANISKAIAENGGHGGANNPRYGQPVTEATREKMRQSAAVRDNTHVGKWVRTDRHRDALSARMIDRIQSGTAHRVFTHTKPELDYMSLLDADDIPYHHQFLLQFGPRSRRFRHMYDFHLTGTNILVEVDGDYWHSRSDVQERDRECERVAKEQGFIVIRFWQSEIEQQPESVVRATYEEIQRYNRSQDPHLLQS